MHRTSAPARLAALILPAIVAVGCLQVSNSGADPASAPRELSSPATQADSSEISEEATPRAEPSPTPEPPSVNTGVLASSPEPDPPAPAQPVTLGAEDTSEGEPALEDCRPPFDTMLRLPEDPCYEEALPLTVDPPTYEFPSLDDCRPPFDMMLRLPENPCYAPSDPELQPSH